MPDERKPVMCRCGEEMHFGCTERYCLCGEAPWGGMYTCRCGWTSPYREGDTPEDCERNAYAAATRRPPVDENTSDGYHTFKELYYHRAVLFAALIAQMPEKAWKSKTHSDGSVWDGWFIVGLETPEGMATYHYADSYWDMFCCKEVERAPEWDGHTPAQAIERIALLTHVQPNLSLTQDQIEKMPRLAAVWIYFSKKYDPMVTSAQDALIGFADDTMCKHPIGSLFFANPPTESDIDAALAAKGENL